MEFIKKHWKDILILVFFFVIIVLLMSTTCANRKNGILENNIKALNDTVKTYQLKNGDLMHEKQGYILKTEELERYLDISKKEVKEYEKKLNSALATISKLQGQLSVDTLQANDSSYVGQDSTTYYNKFNYADNWLRFDGLSVIKLNPFDVSTTINGITMDVPLKVGMTKDNKWFAVSDNPYLHFTSIEGANLMDAKPKKWSIGVQFGVGATFGYGISGAKDGIVRTGWFTGLGAYVGVGVTYKLLEF